MTKEIKFRAQHIKNKFWLENFHITNCGNYIYECDEEKYLNGKTYNRDEVELMQFTGLKDKNGKEIYEGDIVEHIPKFETRYEIKHLTGGFYICPIGKDYGEYFATLFAGYEEKTNICKSLEIIGNIYESELLEDK